MTENLTARTIERHDVPGVSTALPPTPPTDPNGSARQTDMRRPSQPTGLPWLFRQAHQQRFLELRQNWRQIAWNALDEFGGVAMDSPQLGLNPLKRMPDRLIRPRRPLRLGCPALKVLNVTLELPGQPCQLPREALHAYSLGLLGYIGCGGESQAVELLAG